MKCQCNRHDDPCRASADMYVTRDGVRLAVCDRCHMTGDSETTMIEDNATPMDEMLDNLIRDLHAMMSSQHIPLADRVAKKVHALALVVQDTRRRVMRALPPSTATDNVGSTEVRCVLLVGHPGYPSSCTPRGHEAHGPRCNRVLGLRERFGLPPAPTPEPGELLRPSLRPGDRVRVVRTRGHQGWVGMTGTVREWIEERGDWNVSIHGTPLQLPHLPNATIALDADELEVIEPDSTDGSVALQGDIVTRGPDKTSTEMLDEVTRTLGWRTDWACGDSPITWDAVIDEVKRRSTQLTITEGAERAARRSAVQAREALAKRRADAEQMMRQLATAQKECDNLNADIGQLIVKLADAERRAAPANERPLMMAKYDNSLLNSRDVRQTKVSAWIRNAFGEEGATIPQRGIRLLEEALEAYQAAGCDQAMAHELVDYVFKRPVGDLAKELGGVGVCVLGLAAAAKVSADDEEAREVERVLSKGLDEWRERNAAKNEAGLAHAPAKANVYDPEPGLGALCRNCGRTAWSHSASEPRLCAPKETP